MSGMMIVIAAFVFLAIGVPIGVALALAMFLLLAVNPVTTNAFVAQSMYSGIASFTLTALPFFMIAGSIMDTGGISKRLVRVANTLVGNVTGGLGIVSILACMFFGAISGSAPATVAAIGTIMIPQMYKEGYTLEYSTGLIAVAGGLGVIVPPSYPMVIYGVTNDVSIGSLFIAGIGPALVVGGILMIFNHYFCRKNGWKGNGEKASLKGFFAASWDAKWAIFMPVIILGGIYSGKFTPTEASVAAVVYGIIVGVFFYKELSLKKLLVLYRDNTAFIGGLMLTFAPAAVMGAIFAYLGIPDMVKSFVLGISTNVYVVLFIIYLLMLVVGMFVQTSPAIIILSPILLTIVQPLGIDPIHFGIIMTLSLAIAFVTPPVAVNLFVASSLSGISVERIAKVAFPFIVALFIALVIIGYIPEISLFLL